jgi:putative MATE family efflux protein
MILKRKKKIKTDLLSYIRNGQEISARQQLQLVVNLSIPAIMAQLTSILMQYIDTSMVGRLGADNSAAIGLVSTTTWLFGSICYAATIGFTVQVAQYIGARKNEKAKEVLRQSLTSILLFSLLLTFVGLLISRFVPIWLGGSQELYENATKFFAIYICSLSTIGLNALAGGMLQCSGNMKIPSILNALMCGMDVVFNAFLIFPQHEISLLNYKIIIPGANLGVTGAALGTAFAEILTACLMLYFLCFRTPSLRLKKGESYKPTKECLNRAIRIALPVGFEHFIVCSAMIVTTRIVAPLGIIAIAANSFAITAESLCYMPGYGIADAATTLIGQSVGAGRKELTRHFGRITVFLGIAVMAFTGAVMFFAAPIMMSLLSPDLEVRELGTQMLRIEAFAEPLFAASIVVSGVLRGTGDTLIPSMMNFFSMWVVRLPLSWLFAKTLGLKGVWIAMCIELCFRGAIFLIRLYRGEWIK